MTENPEISTMCNFTIGTQCFVVCMQEDCTYMRVPVKWTSFDLIRGYLVMLPFDTTGMMPDVKRFSAKN